MSVALFVVAVLLFTVGLPLLMVRVSRGNRWDRPPTPLWEDHLRWICHAHGLTAAESDVVRNAIGWGRQVPAPLRAATVEAGERRLAGLAASRPRPGWRGRGLLLGLYLVALIGFVVWAKVVQGRTEPPWPLAVLWFVNPAVQLYLRRRALRGARRAVLLNQPAASAGQLRLER